MGFLKPDLPQVDYPEWSKGTRSERIQPLARHWAEVGFGTPIALHLFYVRQDCAVHPRWLGFLPLWLPEGINGFTDVSARGGRSRSSSRRSSSTRCCSRSSGSAAVSVR